MFLLAPCGSRRREFPEELWSIIELYDAAAVTRLEVHVSYKFPLDAQHPYLVLSWLWDGIKLVTVILEVTF